MNTKKVIFISDKIEMINMHENKINALIKEHNDSEISMATYVTGDIIIGKITIGLPYRKEIKSWLHVIAV